MHQYAVYHDDPSPYLGSKNEEVKYERRNNVRTTYRKNINFITFTVNGGT